MVKVNDMYYAWSPDDEIAESGECGGAVTSVMKFLLEAGIVDAVLAVKKGADLLRRSAHTNHKPKRNHRNSRIPTLRNTKHCQNT